MERTSKSGEEKKSFPQLGGSSASQNKSVGTNVAQNALLDIIYLVNGEFVRTNQLMKGEVQPIGIIVPYTVHNKKQEFIVYYDDEHAMLSYTQAKVYAWHRLPCYQGNHWRVKSSTDDSHMSNLLPVINELCRKMGGKSIKGLYIDSLNIRNQKVTPQHKIRYVCDILI